MKLRHLNQNRRGIALVIVMIVVVAFGLMAALMAYSTKVETKLARNSSWDTQLEWMGRSGVELAKFFIMKSGAQGYHGLNQTWAGGRGETNDALEGLSLTDNQLGDSGGTFSVKIVDCDRKFNINMAAQMPDILNQALILIGVEATEAPHLVAAIQDWIDRDDNVTAGGQDTESSYYMSLPSPYHAKNGPIDDLTEMMMIKGVNEAMFFGSGTGAAERPMRRMRSTHSKNPMEEMSYPVGFVDLFTAISSGRINCNTANATVLQLIPDVDANIAQAIITQRAGPNGVEGDEDDAPFRSPGEIAGVPGMPPGAGPILARAFTTRSVAFEVTVEATVGEYKRTFHALVRQLNQNQVVTCYMWWN